MAIDQPYSTVRNLPKAIDEPYISKLLGYEEWHKIKRSILWDLSFLKGNLLRHNLNVMHIEKIFFNNIFNFVMDINSKIKDNDKTRKNLALYCRRPNLKLKLQANSKVLKLKANCTLNT